MGKQGELQQLVTFVRSIFYIQGSIPSGEGERFTITCWRLAMLLRRLEALLRKGKPRSFDHLFPLRERDCLTSFFSGLISSRAILPAFRSSSNIVISWIASSHTHASYSTFLDVRKRKHNAYLLSSSNPSIGRTTVCWGIVGCCRRRRRGRGGDGIVGVGRGGLPLQRHASP